MAPVAMTRSTKATGRRRHSWVRAGYLLLGFPLLTLGILGWVSWSAPAKDISPSVLIIMIISAVPIVLVLVLCAVVMVLLLVSVITSPFDRARIQRRMKRLLESDRDGLALYLFNDRHVKDGLAQLGLSTKRLDRYLITHIDESGVTILDYRTEAARFSTSDVSGFSVGIPSGAKHGYLIAHIKAGETEHALPVARLKWRGSARTEDNTAKANEVREAAAAAFQGRPSALSVLDE